MKRLLVSCAVALGGIPCLLAGPEPIESKDKMIEPAPVVKECNWTGFYFGGQGGYAWGDLSLHEITDVPNDDNPFYHLDQESFFGGGQVGFNWQIWHWLVIGVEGEFVGGDFGDRDHVTESEDPELSIGHSDADWFATVAGRIGVSAWHNRLLPYVKIGAAFTDFDYAVIDLEDGSTVDETWHEGHGRDALLVGGGLEYAFNCHWSVKLEYKHFFYDRHVLNNESVDPINGPNSEDKHYEVNHPEMDTVSAGLNFRF